jgi:hypothetical protein
MEQQKRSYIPFSLIVFFKLGSFLETIPNFQIRGRLKILYDSAIVYFCQEGASKIIEKLRQSQTSRFGTDSRFYIGSAIVYFCQEGASKIIEPKRGWSLKTWPEPDRFGLTLLLTGGLFHVLLFPVYFQEPFDSLVQPAVQNISPYTQRVERSRFSNSNLHPAASFSPAFA